MVPVRIELEGFLSYREKAVIDFDGAPLWMLTGKNGVGKSAVFDAMTFVLFGDGRFGSRDVEPYMNHHAPKTIVELDFEIADKRWRVRRTVERKIKRSGEETTPTSSFQAWELPPLSVHKNAPVEIPETDSNTGFKEWVKRTLRMDAATFTAAILLRQNESDALLSSDRHRREDVLGRVIDLHRYDALHVIVRDRMKEFKVEADLASKTADARAVAGRTIIERCVDRLGLAAESYPTTGGFWRTSANGIIRNLTEIASVATLEIARLNQRTLLVAQVEAHMSTWETAQKNRAKFEWDRSAFAEILERATQIERDAARDALLKASVQLLMDWANSRMSWRSAKKAINSLVDEIGQANSEVTEAETALEEARSHHDQAREEKHRLDVDLATARERLVTLDKRLEQLELSSQGGQGAVCTVCSQPLSVESIERLKEEAKGDVVAVATDIEKLTVQINTAQNALKKTKAIVESAEMRVKRLRTLLIELNDKLSKAKLALSRSSGAARGTLAALETAAKTTASRYFVESVPYKPERFARQICPHNVALNDEDVEKDVEEALKAGLYPDESEISLISAELESRSGAWKAYEALQNARQEAGNLAGQIKVTADQITAIEDTCSSIENNLANVTSIMDTACQAIDAEIALFGDAARISDVTQRDQAGKEMLIRIAATATRPKNAANAAKRAFEQSLKEVEQRQRDAIDLNSQLNSVCKEYDQAASQRDAARKQQKLHDALERRLDANGVQSYLRKSAEQQIVIGANTVLERLSGGMLRLQLNADSTEALDLRIINHEITAAEQATTRLREMKPAALSGSQKFRVAVALALGIGQYACQLKEGGIESVIIDEGFGSLDKEGREKMIEELNGLGSILKRTIVVSHQEEFQTAFMNRIEVGMRNGSAVVIPSL